jgi:hypothetical protein
MAKRRKPRKNTTKRKPRKNATHKRSARTGRFV